LRGTGIVVSDGPEGNADADRIRAVYGRRSAEVGSDRYSMHRPGNVMAVDERGRVLRAALSLRGFDRLSDLDILEVGCGNGNELVWLVSLGADPHRLHGIDLLDERVEVARSSLPEATVVLGDATRLPYADGTFDLTYQATALSSMPSRAMRSRVAAEMRRVTRQGGCIVSYDFAWNPINRDTVGIDGRELRRLFPGLPIEIHRVTLVPPLARWVGDRSLRALHLLAAVAPLRSHRLAIIDIPRE
jgi:SAM-dependent methyltransferase